MDKGDEGYPAGKPGLKPQFAKGKGKKRRGSKAMDHEAGESMKGLFASFGKRTKKGC